ncbi:precorrin-2 dehydrogenase/sirohydrochlorin ferrochelatase family protein [Alteribacillus iranensis]|uniref:precorrin-2 dehydrogenase n=1 Tax=Alteribacillus iranensis TaxID=930128 RepID=A0A1I2B549_9BACI|nr:bifunctional precorrin-2 dehydrogenase/sirohydrochlorin ferrochelatase [Alteribacillus iranensis]SFE51284.1 precorrin-2 dehydrogenase / sirohydrochlorin ferrochelatase [Alteribacillus iranensis]
MFNFPLFLDVTDKKVVIAGGGNVALRKARKLTAAAANVIVVAPHIVSPLYEMYKEGTIDWMEGKLDPEHIRDAFLTVSASGSSEAQHIISQTVRPDQLVNGADQPAIGNVAFPASVEEEEIHIAISTKGKDPSRAKVLREELEEWLKERQTKDRHE